MATSTISQQDGAGASDRRVRRGTTPDGCRMAEVQLDPGESISLYGDGDGKLALHSGTVMVRGLERDDIEVREGEDFGAVTIRFGRWVTVHDTCSAALDGAWTVALAWILDGDRDPLATS